MTWYNWLIVAIPFIGVLYMAVGKLEPDPKNEGNTPK